MARFPILNWDGNAPKEASMKKPLARPGRPAAMACRLHPVLSAGPEALLARERHPAAVEIDLQHLHLRHVAHRDHLARVLHILVGKLRDVDQSVLMDTDVHKRPETGHVRHHPFQDHPFPQILRLKPPGDAQYAANRHIQIGMLPRGRRAGRVDRRVRLADHDLGDFQASPAEHRGHKRVGPGG